MCSLWPSTVGNVGGKYQSHLKHIHLALLIRHSHLKQFGMDVILKPLIDDLKQLSTEGFTVSEEHKVYAALATIANDWRLPYVF